MAFTARTLSFIEYYHACVGISGRTLEVARENTFVLEGEGHIDIDALSRAVEVAANANPGARLRLVGDSLRARWQGDGETPPVRRDLGGGWSGRSEVGADFIRATPLSARAGITAELIVAGAPADRRRFVVFRSLHSAMDGVGSMHFLHEIFRALRGEPLRGSNAFFRDSDLMRRLADTSTFRSAHRARRRTRPLFATGGPRGSSVGDCWQVIDTDGPLPWLLARVAVAIAGFAHGFADGAARIAVPVNLRPHLPGVSSTMNLTGMHYVDLHEGDGLAQFQQRLHAALQQDGGGLYHRAFDYVRALPLGWLERLLCRTPRNYLSRHVPETAMISDLGAFRARDLSGGGFSAQRLFGIPIPGNTFGLLCTLDDRISVNIGMPAVYASDGRLAALTDRIAQILEAD